MNGTVRARVRVENSSNIAKTSMALERRTRVYVYSSTALLQERLVRALGSEHDFEVVTQYSTLENEWEKGIKNPAQAQILVLFSSGLVMEDLRRIHGWKARVRELKVLVLSASRDEADFLQYVRSGVHGFLPADLGAKEIVVAVRGLGKGEAICSGTQCAILFHYLEKEVETFPSGPLHRDLGLTRREQRLIPLLTRGLTNKEIANHFSLSEQTVKNHLYGMKRKVGPHGRLEIVDVSPNLSHLVCVL